MDIFTSIPITISLESVCHKAHISVDATDRTEYEEIIETARSIANAKALCKECTIQSDGDDTISVDATAFQSDALARMTADAHKVYAFVATCGTELDLLDKMGETDILKKYFIDALKEHVLRQSFEYLDTQITRKYHIPKTASICPGSADVDVWPIQQQKQLFSLLGDVKKAIGVTLTSSCLMKPTKSISGFIFPTETDFYSCQLCTRAHCPGRKAAFAPTLRNR